MCIEMWKAVLTFHNRRQSSVDGTTQREYGHHDMKWSKRNRRLLVYRLELQMLLEDCMSSRRKLFVEVVRGCLYIYQICMAEFLLRRLRGQVVG